MAEDGDRPVNPATRPLTESERKFIDRCYEHGYSHVLRVWVDDADFNEKTPVYLPVTVWSGVMQNYVELPQLGFTWYFFEGKIDLRECIPIEDAIRCNWIRAAEEDGAQRWHNIPNGDGATEHPDGRFGDVDEYKKDWHPAPNLLKRPTFKTKRDIPVPRWSQRA